MQHIYTEKTTTDLNEFSVSCFSFLNSLKKPIGETLVSYLCDVLHFVCYSYKYNVFSVFV